MILHLGEDEVDKHIEKENMEIGHDEEAEGDGGDAKELGFVVRRDAVDDVISDGFVKNDDETAGCDEKNPKKERPPAKSVFRHKGIIACLRKNEN